MNTCQQCNKSFVARADAKFCSLYCRSAFHNLKNKRSNAFVRRVNKELSQNRQVLLRFLRCKKQIVREKELLQMRFNFTYFTEHIFEPNNAEYFYVYDVGLKKTNGKAFEIVRKPVSDQLYS